MLKAVGSRKDLEYEAYYDYISDIINSTLLQDLKNYTHHVCTTRFQHSVNVSYYNYKVCHLFGLNERAGARAGLLHDLYFYSTDNKPSKAHLKAHPLTALQNANEVFILSAMEQDIISKHMFPITKELPKYRETCVIIVVDKYCAVMEHIAYRFGKISSFVKRRTRRVDVVSQNSNIR